MEVMVKNFFGPSRWLLVPISVAALVLFSAACGDDDDDDDTEEDLEEAGEEAEEGLEEAEEEAEEELEELDEDDGDDDDGASPATADEYFLEVERIGEDITAEYPECSEVSGSTGTELEDIDVPDECEAAVEDFADQLEDVDPPDQCEDYHELLVDIFRDAEDSGTLESGRFADQEAIDAGTECFGL
jgi:hypothetical protein